MASYLSKKDKSSVWTLNIAIPQAMGIGFYYNDFYLPPGAELYIYNSDKTVLQGPITSNCNNSGSQFATDLIKGSSVIFELTEPESVKGKSRLSINGIVVSSSDKIGGFGQALPCHLNINCPEGAPWQCVSKSVARILIPVGGDVASCTGSVVNRANEDLEPYFLTAAHCNIAGNNVGAWQFRFKYESPNCSNPSQEPSYWTVYGSQLISQSQTVSCSQIGKADFLLLKLNTTANDLICNGITYAGWTRQYEYYNYSNQGLSSVVGIHHPNGDIKKISFSYQTPSISWFETSSIGCEQNLGSSADKYYWKVGWSSVNGQIRPTEGGSSGSALFDPNQRIIGQLRGGTSSCSTGDYDYYGRINTSWNGEGTPSSRLKDWLDPYNTNQISTNTIGLCIPIQIRINGGSPTGNSSPINICSNRQYTLTLGNSPWATSATWSVSGNSGVTLFTANSGLTAYLTSSNNNSFTLQVTACRNGCCSTTTFYFYVSSWCPGSYRIYPNPATNKLSIEFDQVDNLPDQVSLLTENGSITLEEKNINSTNKSVKSDKKLELEVVNLPRGLYYLQMRKGKEVIKERVILE